MRKNGKYPIEISIITKRANNYKTFPAHILHKKRHLFLYINYNLYTIMKQYILALDQGTSSSRAIVFDETGKTCAVAQKEFRQIFPKSGWVEHDPHEIWSSQASVIAEAITSMDINGLNIAGIGITNQRETTIVWDSETEEPVYNAIVWQDRRTSSYCDELKNKGLTDMIRKKQD